MLTFLFLGLVFFSELSTSLLVPLWRLPTLDVDPPLWVFLGLAVKEPRNAMTSITMSKVMISSQEGPSLKEGKDRTDKNRNNTHKRKEDTHLLQRKELSADSNPFSFSTDSALSRWRSPNSKRTKRSQGLDREDRDWKRLEDCYYVVASYC